MLHTARLLLTLAGLAAAGAALAHAGIHAHTHPHPDLDSLLVMLAGAALGVLYARRAKREKWGQTPFSGESGGENGV